MNPDQKPDLKPETPLITGGRPLLQKHRQFMIGVLQQHVTTQPLPPAAMRTYVEMVDECTEVLEACEPAIKPAPDPAA